MERWRVLGQVSAFFMHYSWLWDALKRNVFSLHLKMEKGVYISDGNWKIIPQEGGLDSWRLCLLLCFLIFMELQGDLRSGNKVILVGNRGQLIPWGTLKSILLLTRSQCRQASRSEMCSYCFSCSQCASSSVLYKMETLYWVDATSRQESIAVI